MTTLIKWSDALSVGIAEIDAQHQQLVGMINDLHGAMKQRQGPQELGAILERMANYVRVHFDTEEKYFERFGYPATREHILEHIDFAKRVFGFRRDHESGALMLSMEVMHFLRDWLTAHIQGSDQAYSDCFRQHGLR